MSWKKLVAYAVVIVVLLVASFMLHDLRSMREARRQKEVQASGGGEGDFSVNEIARVLRLRVELDATRDLVEKGRSEAIYRVHERTYNRMLSALSYRESNLQQAVERVEREKATIMREAVNKFLADEMPETLRGDAERGRIWRVQKLLRVQGIYLGRPTARADADTIYAVKTWQLRAGQPQTGKMDEKLVEALMASYVRQRMKIQVRLFSNAAPRMPADRAVWLAG